VISSDIEAMSFTMQGAKSRLRRILKRMKLGNGPGRFSDLFPSAIVDHVVHYHDFVRRVVFAQLGMQMLDR